MRYAVRIAGMAGEGIMVAGRMLGKVLARYGYSVVGYVEYPSLVRGGHNVMHIEFSDEDVFAPTTKVDVLLALNKLGILFHKNDLKENAIIVADETIEIDDKDINARWIRPNFAKIISDANLSPKVKNVISLAILLSAFDIPKEYLYQVVEEEFGRKGKEIVEMNKKAIDLGYMTGNEKIAKLEKKERKSLFLTGNEAVSLGAIAGGMKMYFAYPMTPASNVLHFLAKYERDLDIVVRQPEDEISAILHTIGSWFAGARAMVGTSGGGFSLMVESLGLAGLSETPVVVYIAQRVGPSTGMPTWTEQGDFRFVLHASQGEFPRIVIAPGDVDECFYLVANAFNWAEKYQMPVIILSDKYLAETLFTTKPFDENVVKVERYIYTNEEELQNGERFLRYKITENGISPRPIPGVKGGMHVATSYEHGENGFSSEDFDNRKAQVEKRLKKLETFLKEENVENFVKEGDGEVALIVWGSQKGVAREARRLLEKNGEKVSVISFNVLYPLNVEKIKKEFEKYSIKILFENNATGQFHSLLKENEIPCEYLVLKYTGRPFFPEEMVEITKKILAGKIKEPIVRLKERKSFEYYYPFKYMG